MRGVALGDALSQVSFKALPGDMIALSGLTGSGTSTLLEVLAGYLPPTAGEIRVDGVDLYRGDARRRGLVGFVPRHDDLDPDPAVHPELTVSEAIRSTARVSLPAEITGDEIHERVTAIVAQLGLEPVRHLQIGRGRRTSVAAAVELAADPAVLLLDQPTLEMPLDDSLAFLGRLAALARARSMVVIVTIHQPTAEQLERFDLVLTMGRGGVPMFYGSPQEAYAFFGSLGDAITDPSGVVAALTRREGDVSGALGAADREAGRSAQREAASTWHRAFFASDHPTHRKMYGGERAMGQGPPSRGQPRGAPSFTGQLRALVSRYVTIKQRQVPGTAIALVQAPVFAIVLALVFSLRAAPPRAFCVGVREPDHAAALFAVVLASVWFGVSNAAREIATERAVYRRERTRDLGMGAYVASKVLVLSALGVAQCAALLAIVSPALAFHGGAATFAAELGVLVMANVTGVALGLVLSAMTTTGAAAMTFARASVLLQGLLGGFLVRRSASRPLSILMDLTPTRWAFHAVLGLERDALGACAQATVASGDPPGIGMALGDAPTWAPPTILACVTVALLTTAIGLLARRERA